MRAFIVGSLLLGTTAVGVSMIPTPTTAQEPEPVNKPLLITGPSPKGTSISFEGIGPVVQAQREAEAAALALVAQEAEKKKYGRTGVDWDGIARCETGGDWNMVGPTYSGGVGFANTTWTGFGGGEFASHAGYATREQQIIVAERVYARHGLSGWGCKEYG